MRRLIPVAFAGTVLLAACGGSSDPSTTGAADNTRPTKAEGKDHGAGTDDARAMDKATPATCSPSGAALSIRAKDIAFDKDCLSAPAGQPFTIAFTSEDSQPHSIAILGSHSSTEVLFRGELFPGPKTTTYNVSALKAGSYVFHCEVHPEEMKGDFVVS